MARALPRTQLCEGYLNSIFESYFHYAACLKYSIMFNEITIHINKEIYTIQQVLNIFNGSSFSISVRATIKIWPLTVYNVPMTKIEDLQRHITTMIKKWMGIPKNMSNSYLYSKTAKLKFPFTSLTEEYKATKAIYLVTFQHSSDPCIREANIKVDSGRKLNTPMEIEDAKS